MIDILTLSVENNAPVQFDKVIPGPRLQAAVAVGYPDDETDWCGGYAIVHPKQALIICDKDRRGIAQRLRIHLDLLQSLFRSGFLCPIYPLMRPFDKRATRVSSLLMRRGVRSIEDSTNAGFSL